MENIGTVQELFLSTKLSISVYSALFILMFIEGPIVAFAAAFASSQGYLNVWVIFLLFVFGNQFPDLILFETGKRLRKGKIEKFVSRFGLNEQRIMWIEKNINKHPIKVITAIKLANPITLPGIILTGYAKMSLKSFFWINFWLNILFAAVFVLLGYYSGIATRNFLRYFQMTEYLIISALILMVIIYSIIKFISHKTSDNLEKKER